METWAAAPARGKPTQRSWRGFLASVSATDATCLVPVLRRGQPAFPNGEALVGFGVVGLYGQPENLPALLAKCPLGRLGTVNKVAALAL